MVFALVFSFLYGCTALKPKVESRETTEENHQQIGEAIPPEPPTPEQPLLGGKGAKGKPYEVNGRTYYPLLTAEGYEERGVASWYGPSFHGRRTSCGERFDMHKVSAAHKLLPMHTKIEVTNLENGKRVTLTVNDRGPFVHGRVLDLSYAAAKSLDMVDKGLARVLIRTSEKVEGQKNEDMVGRFFVHIGSFRKKADAKYLLDDMKSLKYKPSTIKVVKVDRDGEILWRVELGPYKSMSAANRAHTKTVKDYPSAFVVASETI
ncbi:MAG: septal ring lytic transglycosylase RlpA family protein [Desulfobacteraceae bacterium]|nr:MAG: septal ring lytic transglycosylase RlpA family protein [Desulfobacteraceae bacterium]